LLQARGQKVFTHYVNTTYPLCPADQKDLLLLAFEAGSRAAKDAGETGDCPYSASDDPDAFMAWLEGFRCCSE
jgi:hypothetical protein